MSPTNLNLSLFLFFFLLLNLVVDSSIARKHHAITFKSTNLFPESLLWDPRDQHFLVGSLRRPTLKSVSDAGIVDSLFPATGNLAETSLPPDSFILGLALDRRNRRLLAIVHRQNSASLASFDLKSRKLIHLTPLIIEDGNDQDSEKIENSVNLIKQVTSAAGEALDDGGEGGGGGDRKTLFAAWANDVAVDFGGNAYVTSSLHDVIWKVSVDGVASVLSRSGAYKGHSVEGSVGLNGVVYSSKGYLLVVQSNSGKLFKVDVDSGVARRVILNKDLVGGDGMAMRSDGVVVVVSQEKLYFLKSDDSWGQGAVFDETTLEVEKQASGIAVGDEDRVYVLYGYGNEGIDGNVEREEFSIVEIESEKEAKEDSVWVFVVIGMGLAYFMFWRFQMRHLVQNMNKKRA